MLASNSSNIFRKNTDKFYPSENYGMGLKYSMKDVGKAKRNDFYEV